MYEWNEEIQNMIDWIEAHIGDNPSLSDMSQQIGYSPYYCSVQFHRICGMTIKRYISGRRLSMAALSLRDTDRSILDIALMYGFPSQEALTRAFRAAFGCTPASYRKNPCPIPLPIRKVVCFPEHYHKLYKGEITMKMKTTEATVHMEYIPAHKYLGIWDTTADNYGDFWKNRDCDNICGIIDSLNNICDPIVTSHTAGWYYLDGVRRYFYGLGVPADYNGEIPEGFELREFPGSYYLVFHHPPFDYLADNNEAMSKVETLAWNYDLETASLNRKYEWNKDVCQCYQRHCPEVVGYEILRPVRERSGERGMHEK